MFILSTQRKLKINTAVNFLNILNDKFKLTNMLFQSVLVFIDKLFLL